MAAAETRSAALIHDGNIHEVELDDDIGTITIVGSENTSVKFCFSRENDQLVLREHRCATRCVLQRLDNERRTVITRDGTTLVDVTADKLMLVIDTIEQHFGFRKPPDPACAGVTVAMVDAMLQLFNAAGSKK